MDHINDEISNVKVTYVLGLIREGGSMFDPDMKCAEALNVNGEAYDKNGMCSLYQYYKQIFN